MAGLRMAGTARPDSAWLSKDESRRGRANLVLTRRDVPRQARQTPAVQGAAGPGGAGQARLGTFWPGLG